MEGYDPKWRQGAVGTHNKVLWRSKTVSKKKYCRVIGLPAQVFSTSLLRQPPLIEMPEQSLTALILGSVVGGGQLIFFLFISVIFSEKEVNERDGS